MPKSIDERAELLTNAARRLMRQELEILIDQYAQIVRAELAELQAETIRDCLRPDLAARADHIIAE